MEPTSSSRLFSRALVVLLGVFALGGCTSAPPSLSPSADPSPTPAISPAPSAVPSAAVTPGPASPTAAPSPAATNGSWTRLGDMSEPRWTFTALELLDGSVLVVDQRAHAMCDLEGPPGPPRPRSTTAIRAPL